MAFISIMMIGMLAALAYLGIAYPAAALKKDALAFFNSRDLWDLEITSTLLMTEDDLDAIRAVPGVGEAESVFQVDTRLHQGAKQVAVSVVSLPEKISAPVLLEGRLPESRSECAVERDLAEELGLAIGQQLEIPCQPIMEVDPLLESSFVITGIFHTPDHFSYMIPVTPYVFVKEDVFNHEGLNGAFMKTRIRADGLPDDRYSEEYESAIAPVISSLQALSEERTAIRDTQVREVFEKNIREGEAKIEDGRAQLRQAKETIEEGREELARGEEQLGEMKALIDAAEARLVQGQALLESGRRKAADTGNESLMDVVSLAEQIYAILRDNWYYSGEQYLDGITAYLNGKKQLEEGERQYAEGEEALRSAEEQLADAKKRAGSIESCRWVILSNRGNPGFIYADANAEKLGSLSLSFSPIFLIVGAMVIYATIARMVEQQRKMIGVHKALGVFNREIFAKYLLFALTAVVIGIGLGVLLAWLPMQRAVLSSYEEHLNYGMGTRAFLPVETALVFAGGIGISVVAVYLGCSGLLRQTALALIQETPSVKRTKSVRSARRSLFARLIFRNMKIDWARVLVTIVSIAGGCMLMVVGFALRYGITGVPARQFGGIMTYDAEIIYDAGAHPEAGTEAEAILDGEGLQHVRLLRQETVYEMNETLNALTLIVAEDGALDGYYNLQDIQTGRPSGLPESGALVPRRFSEYYGLGPGDDVTVFDTALNRLSLPIAGVFENFYGQIFFLTPQGYEAVFGTAPQSNCLFVKTGGMPLEELQQKLAGVEGITAVRDAAAERSMIEQFTVGLNFVVYLMLFIAAMMSCFIVANFTMTFIQKKTTELTIMRINGFSVRECIRYVVLDLVVTTVLGTLLGLIAGGPMGVRILRVTETPYIQMLREPRVESFVFAALFTFAFSLLANGVALRRIRKLKLTDIG